VVERTPSGRVSLLDGAGRYRVVLLMDGYSRSHVVAAVSCLAENQQRRPTVATWPCALVLVVAAFRLHTWHSWLGLDLGWPHSRGPRPDANPRLLLVVSSGFLHFREIESLLE
jgi:hypothetical protein